MEEVLEWLCGSLQGVEGRSCRNGKSGEYKVGDWVCACTSLATAKHGLEAVTPGRIDCDRVCVKCSVAEPRYTGKVRLIIVLGELVRYRLESDGLLIIEIPNRPIPWQVDPADMDKVENFKVRDLVRAKASVASPKYGWEDVNRNSIGIIHSFE